jgi:2-polyprenyl-3-methyl-5-hydroxy-6-metoxy-1,4-benzoquinol methylase
MRWEDFLHPQSWQEYLAFLNLHSVLVEKIISSGVRKILEIGAGGANLAIFLSTLGMQVTAMDKNKKVLEIAQKNSEQFGGRVEFLCADAFHTPFRDQAFELCVSQGLLEHFADEKILDLVNEQVRIARRVFISIPNHYYPVRDFGDERLSSTAHWRTLIKSGLKKTRFEIRTLEYGRFFLRSHPVRSVLNSLFDRRFLTLLMIEPTS